MLYCSCRTSAVTKPSACDQISFNDKEHMTYAYDGYGAAISVTSSPRCTHKCTSNELIVQATKVEVDLRKTRTIWDTLFGLDLPFILSNTLFYLQRRTAP